MALMIQVILILNSFKPSDLNFQTILITQNDFGKKIYYFLHSYIKHALGPTINQFNFSFIQI